MKKLMISILFMVLGMAPWACTKQFTVPVYPKLPAPFTPTNTSAPSFTMTATTTNTPTVTPFPVIPTSTPTDIPTSSINSPTPNSTPGCGYSNVIIPIGMGLPFPGSVPNGLPIPPWTTVIRSQADWAAYCGTATTPTAPVDFNTQMILAFMTESDCFEKLALTNVCEGPTEVTVDLTLTIYSPNICYAIAYGVFAVAVPQSNLPVIWTVH